jgi:transcriptional regulator with XRE-family HTH domain
MTQVLDATPSVAAGLLQLARLKSGLSQRKLAEIASVPTTMISAYERDLRQPTLPTLLRLLNAAGFDLRMQLIPLDKHDQVLERSEGIRGPEQKHRLDLRLDSWRNAEPA